MDVELEAVSSHTAILGEGPRWWSQRGTLFWVDIDGGLLLEHDPATGVDTPHDLGEKIGSYAPTIAGDLVVALDNGIARYDLETRQLTRLHDPEAAIPKNRFNDGAVDPAGRFWAGTMGPDAGGALYRLDHDGSLCKMLSGISCSNGLCWNQTADTFYYIDTPTRQVRIFAYDNDTGDIPEEREALPIPKELGAPDGMTIDDEGLLWIAHWGGWRVTRWDPATRQQVDTIEVPVERVTAPWFGGADGTDLYITTASIGVDAAERERQPWAGRLLRCRVPVSGPPAALCRLDRKA